MKDLLLILLGGICSAIGGCIAIWYQAKKARKIRMEELRGEQQLEAYKKALSLTDRIWTFSIQGSVDDVLELLYANGEWFSINQALLPHTFAENWRSIIFNLETVKTYKENEQIERNKASADIVERRRFVRQLAKEMDTIIRKELGLKEVSIKEP